MLKNSQAAEKGPDARRRPMAAREAYSLYVERAAEGANEADGPLSAAAARGILADSLLRPTQKPRRSGNAKARDPNPDGASPQRGTGRPRSGPDPALRPALERERRRQGACRHRPPQRPHERPRRADQ